MRAGGQEELDAQDSYWDREAGGAPRGRRGDQAEVREKGGREEPAQQHISKTEANTVFKYLC